MAKEIKKNVFETADECKGNRRDKISKNGKVNALGKYEFSFRAYIFTFIR
jgi:hypothetical protein